MRPPPNSGSYYFNYKHTFSIVLLAIVDADDKFILIDVGCNGRISDGGVYQNSDISTAFEENRLNIPGPKPLPGSTKSIPYMLVADDAFPLKDYIQKPYSQIGLTKEKRIFNYRLSRARRIVENAFGILANQFGVFMTPIGLGPEKVENIVMACCSALCIIICEVDLKPALCTLHLVVLIVKTPKLINLYLENGDKKCHKDFNLWSNKEAINILILLKTYIAI